MSEMMEKVAEAIHSRAVDELSYRKCVELARAAIEAMREPTDAQLAAFHNSCDSNGQCLVKYGYTAMIDAALSGTNHPQ